MPEPPDSGIITRYVLENPWPLGVAIMALAAWLLWSGMREGLLNKVKAGGGIGALGLAIIATGWFVTTSGEHARATTRRMVDAAVAGDVPVAMKEFAPGAAMSFASPKNMGFDVNYIEDQLIALASRYRIESNTITQLRGFSESADVGIVHLSCITQVAGSHYPTVTSWVVRVQKQDDGTWRVVHLTFVTINSQSPRTDLLR